MENILIIGSGAYGSALANVLSDNKHNVNILGVDKNEINDININSKNTKYFSENKLNKNIKGFIKWEKIINDIDIIILAVPSQFISDVVLKINKYVKKKLPIINAVKGFVSKDLQIPFNFLTTKLKPHTVEYIAGIYGPSIASEVMNKKPVLITASSENLENSKKVAKLFTNDYFAVYPSDNIINTEYAVILKNIYAIAAGMASSLFKSQSTISSIIAIAISEIKEIISIYTNHPIKNIKFDISSLADIILTTTTNKSRNFLLGSQIGTKDNANIVIKDYDSTVEGLNSCKLLYNDLSNKQYNLPLLSILYGILFENKKPSSYLYSIFNIKSKQNF